jgi:8-oxo-dGTP pyrophosphatase MutT (NUDIX family)
MLRAVRRTYDFDWFKVSWQRKYGWIFDRRPAVVVIALDPDDRIWLERIARVPTATASWEMPGGMIDADEDPVAAGLRELEEECGLVAPRSGRLLRGDLELAPGMGRFPHHVVIAAGVVPKGKRPVPQKEEGILAVKSFDRGQIRKMMRSGLISVLATLGPLAVSGWLEGYRPLRRSARRRVAARR